ncbi:putative aliphatic sulfonates-binding protein precursor [compost metagenome]
MPKIGHKKLIVIAALAVFIVGGFGIWKWKDTGSAQSSKKPVTINVALNAGLNVLQLIKEQGLLNEALQKYNARVEWSEFASGPPLLESLTAKRVDLSFLGDGAALQGQGAGLDFSNIGLITEGTQINSILVRSESGIQTPEELKGKKLGVAKGTTSHVYLVKFLKQYSLKESDLEIINLQIADAVAAFQSGQVDAIATIDPYTTQLVAQQKGIELKPKVEIEAPVTLIVRNEFADAHPEIVTEILKVYKTATEWQDSHIEEAADTYAELKGLDRDIVKVLINKQASGLSVISADIIETQQESSDFLYQSGFLKKKIQYKNYVDNTYIEAASKQ